MQRLSSYFILSERLKNGGHAVLSGLTGAIELISEELYKVFEAKLRTGNPHALPIEEGELPADIWENFRKRGHITQLSHAEERAVLEKVASYLHEAATKHAAVVIVPELDCNYRCTYCFERPLQQKLRACKTTMDKREVDAVFESVDQIVSEIGPIGNAISLFGGEPLLEANVELVQYIVEKGAKRGLSFKAITNGHGLHAYSALLGKGKIESLQITIDGPKHIHDKRRISLDGHSSYERIMGNMRQALAQSEITVSVRTNIDESNCQAFEELLQAFAQEGWLNNDRVFVHAAIVDKKEKSGAMVPLLEMNKVRAPLSCLAKQYSNVGIGSVQTSLSNSVFSALARGSPYSLRSTFCGASSGMYVFLPGGNISCCWETLGEESGYIGSYSEEGLLLDTSKTQHKFGRCAAKIPACADCKYCLVCAGGCPQAAEYASPEEYKPHCGDFPQSYAWVLADAVENHLKAQNL